MSTSTASAITPPRRPPIGTSSSSSRHLSLPLIPTSSPFLLPFEPIQRGSTCKPSSSTTTSCTVSPFVDPPSPANVTEAYVAARSAANLVRVLDLDLKGERNMQRESGNEPKGASERYTKAEDDHGTTIHSELGTRPHTPSLLPVASRDSPYSPLTRENMAKLKAGKTASPSSGRLAAPAQLRVSQGDSTLRNGSNNFDKPLRSPIQLHDTTEQVNIAVGRPNQRETMFSDATDSSFASLQTADFAMPTGKKGNKLRSDVFAWPHHGPQSRAGFERDMASRIIVQRDEQATGEVDRGLEDSFMSMGSGDNSTTFQFPASTATRSRISIATDASSRYAPSMAAPSSIVRRTAAWAQTGGIATPVPEEDESEQGPPLSHLNDGRNAPTDFPVSPEEHHDELPELSSSFGSHANQSPPDTLTSRNRISQASGDTFGARRGNRSASTYVSEADEQGGRRQRARKATESPQHNRGNHRGPDRQHSPSVEKRSSLAKSRNMTTRPSPEASESKRKPQSDEEITSYLLKAASKNRSRIVPTNREKPDVPISPPSHGTRLKGLIEDLDAENSIDLDSDDDQQNQQATKRLMSKIDQVLGQGAAEAGLAVGYERKILQEALKNSVSTRSSLESEIGLQSLPPLPRLAHKSSASVPACPSGSTSPAPPPLSGLNLLAEPAMSDNPVPPPGFTRTRNRSGSVDSGQVSIADSMTRLIPASHPHPPFNQLRQDFWPLTSSDTKNRAETNQLDLTAKNDLTPEEKLFLIKRVRKLEDRLGATVRESLDGGWVVDERSSISSLTDSPHRRDSSSNNLATKARAALRIDKKEEGARPQPIQIFSDRLPHTDDHVARRGLNDEETPKWYNSAPNSPHVGMMRSTDDTSEDEVGQSSRSQSRQRMARLNRFFGSSPSPAQIGHGSFHGSHRSSIPPRFGEALSSQSSFISMSDSPHRQIDLNASPPYAVEGRSSWSSKLRQSMTKRSNSSKDIHRFSSDNQSFLDFGDDGPSSYPTFGRKGSLGSMKMENQDHKNFPLTPFSPNILRFAENFPHHIINMEERSPINANFSSYPATPSGSTSIPASPYGDFKMAVTRSNTAPALFSRVIPCPNMDRPPLSYEMDTLSTPEPLFPDEGFNSSVHSARRKRNMKLNKFFGENVGDQSHPPSPMLKHRKSTKDILDGLKDDLWKAVQADQGRIGGSHDRIKDAWEVMRSHRDGP